MEFWRDGLVIDLLAISVLLGLTSFLRARLSWMRKLAVPDALVAGTFAVVLGPELLGVIPFDFDRLEFLVYHGFAIVFVAVGLQSPPSAQQRGGSARSFAVALSSIGVLQVLIGFSLLAAIAAVGLELHPGFGFMPLLGFHQGPGPALALGSAWEPLGLVSGAGLGLVFAAFGFASCVFFGVPLVWLGRRAGWVTPRAELEEGEPEPELPSQTRPRAPAIFEPLRTQIIAIGCVYAAVFGLLWTLTSALPAGSGLAATLWGFNFIAGALLAIGLRRSARRVRVELPLDDPMLSRIAVVAVDFTTAAALAAVRMSILDRWLAPIVLLAAVTALASLVVSIWLARRAFPSAPFEHAVALFGATTGTVPTALALLRTLDPELRGPVARNVVLGAAASVPLTAPMMVLVIPVTVELWSQGFATAVWSPLAMMVIYALGLALVWRWLTPFRLLRPLLAPWPSADRAPPGSPRPPP